MAASNMATSLATILCLLSTFTVPVLCEDVVLPIPDQKNFVMDGFTVNSQGNSLTLHDLQITFPSSGAATIALGNGAELNIDHYNITGSMDGFHLKGDGTINIKMYGNMDVTYTPQGTGHCAIAGHTNVTVAFTKIDSHIQGMKADNIIPVDGITNAFLNGHPALVSKALNGMLNGIFASEVDPVLVDLINKHCNTDLRHAVEAAVRALLEGVEQ